jgi:hypothetical protein
MKKILYTTFIIFFALTIKAQEPVFQTFKDSRIVNMQSVETLGKRKLDVRIGHRFGDLAGDNGGWTTFFGLENATDVQIGAEYGFTDRFTAGLFRTKGAGSLPSGQSGLRQVLNLTGKYRLVQQTSDGGSPVTLSILGVGSLSTAEKVEGNPDIIQSFDKFAHRMAYTIQVLAARKFSERFSLQLAPAYTHRNIVAFEDENNIFLSRRWYQDTAQQSIWHYC